MTKPKFHFDPESHRYTLDGAVLPSVTTVINAVLPRGYSCPDWYLERGSAIHKAIHLLIQGKLDWGSVDSRIWGRVRAFDKFVVENSVDVLESEVPMFSEKRFYAGTIDALVSFKDNPKFQGHVLVDVKSSLESQLAPQLGAYNGLLREQHPPEVKCAMGLWLREDGTYRTKWFTASELRRAEQLFLNCLSVYNFGKKEGIFDSTTSP